MPALEEAPVQEEAPVHTEEARPDVPQLIHDAVELRAYYRYVDRGCSDGCALDDWLAAEEELRLESEVVSA